MEKLSTDLKGIASFEKQCSSKKANSRQRKDGDL